MKSTARATIAIPAGSKPTGHWRDLLLPARGAGSRLVKSSLARWLFCFALLIGFSAPAAEKFANNDCLDCHTDPTNARKVDGKTVPMAVFPTNTFDKSIHTKLACVDCHTGIKELVHESKLPAPNCVG